MMGACSAFSALAQAVRHPRLMAWVAGKLVLKAVMLAVWMLCFANEKAEAAPKLEQFTLKNGMEVVVIENHRLPIVSHTLWYKVGAADDPLGKSGLAHYNEHMMFQGTAKIPVGEFSSRVAIRGGQDNAFTSRDYTGYYVNIAKEHLPLVMELEADRMRGMQPSPENFTREREVIIEERRSRIDNLPTALLAEQMDAALFRHHPYRVPVIGWKHEMQSLSREDVLAFHQAYYYPNNAVLVVAGDITRAELEPLAEQWYGAIAPSPQPITRTWTDEPPFIAAARLTLSHENVKQPLWQRQYATSSFAWGEAKHVPALYVLADILGGTKTSRLYTALVKERKLATDVRAEFDGVQRGPAQLVISVTLAERVEPAAIDAAVDAVLVELLRRPPSAEELRRAKIQQTSAIIYAQDGISTLANLIGRLRVLGLPADIFFRWPETMTALTLDDIRAALEAEIRPERSVTGVLLPLRPKHETSAPASSKPPAKASHSSSEGRK